MYKRLLLIPIVLFLSACAQTKDIPPPRYTKSQVAPYSLEALDAQYHQGH